MNISVLELPLQNPIAIFALILFIVLMAPLVLKRFRIPGIVGLIVAGIIIGPYGINIINKDSGINLLGSIGLQYLMFIAGIEINLNEFMQSKDRSLTFGFFTFILPLSFGFLVAHYVLNYDLLPAFLIALMFSTHTLVSYPIAGRLGVNKNRAVNLAVGGTIFTDTAVLLILGLTIAFAKGELNFLHIALSILSLLIFIAIVLKALPWISFKYLKKIETDTTSQFVFILTALFICCVLAQLAGLEPIIGAFFAGLALNRLIPNTSSLMAKIEFVGNSLFIPFFLISVGMMINISVLTHGYSAIIIAFALTVTALLTKWMAAYLTQKFYKFTNSERNLMFGLSSSHAAATIAIIVIGYNMGILDINVLNGTVILILITCLVSSFVTEDAGRKVALEENDAGIDRKLLPQKILVPVANPDNVENLIELAFAVREKKSDEPIYPLTVVMDDDSSYEKIFKSNKQLEGLVKKAAINDVRLQLISRVDTNVVNGVVRAIKELVVNTVIIGWSGKIINSEDIKKYSLEKLLNSTNTTLLVSKILNPIALVSTILVMFPKNAELEIGFERSVVSIWQLASNTKASLLVAAPLASLESFRNIVKKIKYGIQVSYISYADVNDCLKIAETAGKNDMFICVSARNKSLSSNLLYQNVVYHIIKKYTEHNIILMYPEQNPVAEPETVSNSDVLEASMIMENIARLNKISKIFKK